MIIRYRILITALCLAVLQPFFSPTAVASQAQSLHTAKAFITALSQRNADGALQLLSDEAVLEMPYPLATGENAYGTRKMWGDALRQYVAGIIERNSKISFNNVVWRAANDGAVILECDGDMVRSKDGKKYKNKYIIVFEVADEKITLWREYFNPVVAARTFGIPLESLP